MLFFEENIFYPKEYKIDHIKLKDDRVIHYKISSSLDQSRYFIAVTLESEGKVYPQYQLSKQFGQFGILQNYITRLPKRIEDGLDEPTISNQMKVEFDNLVSFSKQLTEKLNLFREKYNV